MSDELTTAGDVDQQLAQGEQLGLGSIEELAKLVAEATQQDVGQALKFAQAYGPQLAYYAAAAVAGPTEQARATARRVVEHLQVQALAVAGAGLLNVTADNAVAVRNGIAQFVSTMGDKVAVLVGGAAGGPLGAMLGGLAAGAIRGAVSSVVQ